MSGMDVGAVLALRARIVERGASLGAPPQTKAESFGAVLERSLEGANAAAQRSTAASTAFETGATTDIASVMLARQESALAFRMALETRNKLLSAYRDIMSLPL
jgi:flagellar hook-basal body complex protein FliE